MFNLNYEFIFKVVLSVCGVLFTTIIPLIISLAKAIKKRKEAKNEAEIAEAEADLLQTAILLIDSAETLYKDVDKALKSKGESAGPVKKETVMMKLQTYANEKQYDFDAEKWSGVIDGIVKITKNVNGRIDNATNIIRNAKVGG